MNHNGNGNSGDLRERKYSVSLKSRYDAPKIADALVKNFANLLEFLKSIHASYIESTLYIEKGINRGDIYKEIISKIENLKKQEDAKKLVDKIYGIKGKDKTLAFVDCKTKLNSDYLSRHLKKYGLYSHPFALEMAQSLTSSHVKMIIGAYRDETHDEHTEEKYRAETLGIHGITSLKMWLESKTVGMDNGQKRYKISTGIKIQANLEDLDKSKFIVPSLGIMKRLTGGRIDIPSDFVNEYIKEYLYSEIQPVLNEVAGKIEDGTIFDGENHNAKALR